MKPTVIKNYTESASQILDDFIRKISDIIEASPNGGQIENLELELSKLTFEIITFLMTSMRLGLGRFSCTVTATDLSATATVSSD